MIIAQEKRKSNIAEYILYMWQVEDIIRASKFNIELISNRIIDNYQQNPDIKYEIREWYLALIDMMQKENITNHGHLKFINTLIQEVNDLHLRVLKTDDPVYKEQFNKAKPIIEEYKKKSNLLEALDVEICLNGLYALLLLRLQKKEVSKATTDALSLFSEWLANVSQKFRMYENGKLDL